MNIYTQMQSQAEQIVPGIKLAEVLVSPGARKKIPRRKDIAKIVRSGSYYLSPSWLACYYPICEGTLTGIKNDSNLKL